MSSSENISELLTVNRTNSVINKHVPKFRFSSTYNSRNTKNIDTIPVYKLIEHRNLTVDNTELIKASWPIKIFNCIRSRNFIQCMKIFLLQRSESALERITSNQLSKTNISWFDDILTLQNDSTVNLSKYENLTNTELNEQIIANLFQIYDQRFIKFQLLPGVSFQIVPNDEDKGRFDLALHFNQEQHGRGMKMKDLMPLLMVPSVIFTTFLPLLLPSLKMLVMFVMMINQMAFSMALMSLVRGMIFDPRPSDEIVYVNKGYHNKKHHHHPPPHIILPSHGGKGPQITLHDEIAHVGDASQITLTKQAPPLIVNQLPNNFIHPQPNIVNHQIIRPHFVNQRIIRPINAQTQQMIQPNIIQRPNHDIQVTPIQHVQAAVIPPVHQISTGAVPSINHIPTAAISPVHHITTEIVPSVHHGVAPLPHGEQTVFVHQQAEVPELVHYPQSNIHSNVIPQHQSHELDTGLFAEPIGHDQELIVHENWHD